ncbi:MucR family transcriptional regulator [Mesorhizobium sp. M0514]|uniref:MucR family transcriptional regulator n=1 Tax=Mesorhizobium sp. M0514 TaxID=2956955 RepID=UPI003336F53B
MPTPAQSRLMYFMGQLVHNESIDSKQDIIVGLLDHEGSPRADADELLATCIDHCSRPDRACTRRKRYIESEMRSSEKTASLSGLSSQIAPAAKELVPAANPKKSVFADHIISLEDGRKFQSMKRHLGLLGMTPDEYREKWGLSRDYPMVAPNYAAKRSALAKASGLGRKAEVKAPAKRAKKA